MKMYPFRCPECNTIMIKTKNEVKSLVYLDRDGEYYSFSCPNCNCNLWDFEFGNFIRKYNPGYIDKRRCKVYKV